MFYQAIKVIHTTNACTKLTFVLCPQNEVLQLPHCHHRVPLVANTTSAPPWWRFSADAICIARLHVRAKQWRDILELTNTYVTELRKVYTDSVNEHTPCGHTMHTR